MSGFPPKLEKPVKKSKKRKKIKKCKQFRAKAHPSSRLLLVFLWVRIPRSRTPHFFPFGNSTNISLPKRLFWEDWWLRRAKMRKSLFDLGQRLLNGREGLEQKLTKSSGGLAKRVEAYSQHLPHTVWESMKQRLIEITSEVSNCAKNQSKILKNRLQSQVNCSCLVLLFSSATNSTIQ